MLRIISAILLSLFYTNALRAQEVALPIVIVNGDTLPHILLKEYTIQGKKHTSSWYKRYNRKKSRLEYNVKKAYPYAKIAARKINEINNRLASVTNKKEQKKIIQAEYHEMMKVFKKPLMKLSITQGRILIRLIYRETNHTSFAHIREYKGAFNAYFWQSIALLFGNNLKTTYDPLGEDAEIEEIVRKIESGEI